MMKKIILLFLVFFIGLNIYVISQEQPSSEQQISPFDQVVRNISSPDPYTRRQAAEQLGMLRDNRAIPYLKKLLKDENPYVRQTAIDSLGLLRSKESVDDIIKVIKTDKEPQVKQSAVVALGYINEPRSVPVLLEVLKNDKEVASVKYAVCNTLSIIRSTESIPILVSLLETSEDINLKKSIIYALGKIPHNESLQALRNNIFNNLDKEDIIVEIFRVLTELNDVESVEKFKLVYSTNVVSEKTRFYAAYGLAKIAKDSSVLPIIKKSLKSSDENIKNYAIDASRLIGDKETLNILNNMSSTEQSPYTKMLLDMAIKQLEQKFPKQNVPKTTQPKPSSRG